MNKVRIAVVGYGYWSPKLIRNIRSNSIFELRLICEKDQARHSQIQTENPDVEVVQRYQDVFARKDINAVVIATVPSSHFRIAKQALDAGKHVLVEKPLTLTEMEGELLCQLARKRGLTLMVDHTYLYSPAIRKLRTTIQSGQLGSIYSIESARLNFGLFQRDANVVWDLAPHDFSILLFLFDEKPIYVSAIGSKTVVHPKQGQVQESIAHVTLYYASGLTVYVHVSWMSPVKVRQITIIGSEKMILFDQLAPSQLTIFNQNISPRQDCGESGPLFQYNLGAASMVDVPSGREDLAAMLDDFLTSVLSGSEPVSNAALGLDVVRILAAADRSLSAQGRKTRISYISRTLFSLGLYQAYLRWRHRY